MYYSFLDIQIIQPFTVFKITSVSGSSSCFLFTLKPDLGVYTATGYNQNFMYLNQGVQTLPNGLVG